VTEQSASNEPVALHVERRGSGPPLVLAHGFGGSARNFRPQARAFAAERTVVLYDARGHARSAAPEDAGAYDEAALVGDLARVVEQAGAPAVVGGLSLGAYTALRLALARPVLASGLVLASFPAGTAAQHEWARAFAEAIDAEGLDAAGARYAWGERARFDARAAALIRSGFLEHRPHALAALLRNVLAKIPTPDELAGELAGVAVPVLLIAGALDRNAVGACERLAALLPRAELVIVPDAGHVVNLEAPAPFNEALGRFFGALTP
jgi:pimeloyl-ACP methyl ester carboxylesterase